MVGGRSVSAAAADTLSRGVAGAAPPPWTPPGAPGGARGAAGGVAGLPQDFCRHLDDRILIDLRIKIRMGSHHGFFFDSWVPVGAQEKCLGSHNAPLRGNGDFLNFHGSPMPAPQGRNTRGLPHRPQRWFESAPDGRPPARSASSPELSRSSPELSRALQSSPGPRYSDGWSPRPGGFPSWIFLRFLGARLGTRKMFGIPTRAIARQRDFSGMPRISNAGPAGP